MLSAKQEDTTKVPGISSEMKSVGLQKQKGIIISASTGNAQPQMRILQTVSKPISPAFVSHQDQSTIYDEQTLQILRALPSHSLGGVQVITPHSNSTSTCITRVPLASPKKGAVISFPTGRIVTQAGGTTKLKVGDTVVIPTKTLNSINPEKISATEPIVLKNTTSGQLLFTPTKVMPTHMETVLASPAAMRTRLSQDHGLSNPEMHASPARAEAVPPIVWTPSPRYKRSVDATQPETPDNIKRNRRTPSGNEKGNKGLRHFAMLVCEKVKQKNTTTYNEVADELVTEYSHSQSHLNDQQYDQKNIRRRVYDALNVLMAMNIIYKDKKDIHWVGLPTNSVQELQSLQTEKNRREMRIKQKTAQLHELILQQIAFKSLVQRNRQRQQMHGPPPANSAIQLPFIIVNTSKKTVIDCSISNDKYEYLFNFDNTFEIHDDIEVLKRMGMAYGLDKGTCSRENLNAARQLVPPVLQSYLEDMACSIESNTPEVSLSSLGQKESRRESLVADAVHLNHGTEVSYPNKRELGEQSSMPLIRERTDGRMQAVQPIIKAELHLDNSLSPMVLNT